jgi:hypothetical protein
MNEVYGFVFIEELSNLYNLPIQRDSLTCLQYFSGILREGSKSSVVLINVASKIVKVKKRNQCYLTEHKLGEL